MDVVNFTSIFARGLIGRFVNKAMEKKLGMNPEIKLVRFNFNSGSVVKADISIEMPNDKFEKLMEVVLNE